MSLINNMLKDLHKRNKENTASENNIPENLSVPNTPVAPKKKNSHYLFLLIIVIAAMIFIFVEYYLPKKIIPKAPAHQVIQKPLAINNAADFPSRITTFQVTSDNQQTKVVLEFDTDVTYTIQPVKDNHVEIDLQKVTAPANTTLPNVEKTLISSIHTISDPQLLKLTLTLEKNSQLKTEETSGHTKKLELIIDAQKEENTSPMVDKKIIDPTLYQAEMSYQAAMTALKDGRETIAFDALKQAIAENANYYPAQLALIKLYLKKADFKNTQQHLTLALTQRPDEPELLLLQASLWIQENKLTQAENLLSSHLPPFENNLSYYATQAYLENELDHSALAIQLYEQVLAVNPYNGNWWLGLALSLQKNGQKNAAILAYKRALQTNNLNPSVRIYITSQLQLLS